MSAFEFFFSLFGLILGLAVAVVIGGLSDLFRERTRVKTGWLTPMLAIVVLLDLSSCWVNAWSGMSDLHVAYGPFVAALVVAGIYYFAASLVFPKTPSDWPSLDDYYMTRHRFVFGGILMANLGIDLINAAAHDRFAQFLPGLFETWLATLWWAVIIALLVFSNKRVQFAGLTILIIMSIYIVIAYWNPQ